MTSTSDRSDSSMIRATSRRGAGGRGTRFASGGRLTRGGMGDFTRAAGFARGTVLWRTR